MPWLLFLSCKAIVPWKEKDWQRLKIHAPKHYICYHVQQQQKLLRRVSLFIYTIKFHCIWMVRYYHVQQFLLCFFFLFFILKNCDWSSFLFSFCWLIVCFLCERLIYSVCPIHAHYFFLFFLCNAVHRGVIITWVSFFLVIQMPWELHFDYIRPCT